MDERHRPPFHLSPRRGWLNDPNAPIRVDGVYHLFGQVNPAAPVHGDIHWAHWSSADLMEWTELPIALRPRPGGPDADGCWSGSAVVVDGELTLIYSGHLEADPIESVIVARPARGGEVWEGGDAVALPTPPSGVTMMRDPFVWRDGDVVRMILGASDGTGTPVALLYSSRDLARWRYDGVLCGAADGALGDVATGAGWECPQLLRRGDRGVLLMSSWYPGAGPDGVFWASGPLTRRRLRPEAVGRVDYGPEFYAAALLADGDDALLWAWSKEARSPSLIEAAGWAGVLAGPRTVTLGDDGRPGFAPAQRWEALRGDAAERAARRLGPGEVHVVAAGASLDVEARLSGGPGSAPFVRVLAAEDGSEFTEVGWDRDAGVVYVDRQRASRTVGVAGGSYSMPADAQGDDLELRILVDVSLIEVFCGGRSLTLRAYPDSASSSRVVLGSRAGWAEGTVDCWPLTSGSANPMRAL